MKFDTNKMRGFMFHAKPFLYMLGGIACVIGTAISSNRLGVGQGIQATVLEYERDPENFEEGFVNEVHPKKD